MIRPDREIQIMGIINLNDDSFYAPSRHNMAILDSGADIIDLGAVSTRPGSKGVTPDEEWKRLEPVLKVIDPSVCISIDTYSSEVAERAADLLGRWYIVNDISAGEDDPDMLETVGRLGLGYVAMHKRGNPETMQTLCNYDDVTGEVVDYFKEFAVKAEKAGIKDWILDPGFGFAKNVGQNYTMMRELDRFCELGRKILVGISRKSFIYRPLGITPAESLPAVTAMHLVALLNGADILRVHDVAEARQAVELYRNYSSM